MVLVGCGFFGCRAHAPALKKLAARGEVVAHGVCSRTQENRRRAQRKLGATTKEYASLEAVLADADVDVVLLALPRDAVAAAIAEALAAGKTVWSEKPFAWSASAPRRHPRWRVLENWALKPGVLQFKDLLRRRVDRSETRYVFTATLRRSSSSGGWRSALTDREQTIDVAVHFVRALRLWFGEVQHVSTSEDELGAYELRHFDGARGQLRLALVDDTPPSVRCAVNDLVYDVTNRTIADGESTVEVAGDNWIDGGVRDTLKDALRRGGATSTEEARRDLAVVLRCLGGEVLEPLVLQGGEKTFWLRWPPSAEETLSLPDGCRAVGAGTSWGLAATVRRGGLRLETGLMDGILRVDDGAVFVEAGCSVKALRIALAARSLTLAEGLPVYQEATVGGAVATASHGSSARHGTLADAVAAVRLLLSNDDDDEWLTAAEPLPWKKLFGAKWRVDAAQFDAARCCVGHHRIVAAFMLRTRPVSRVVRRHAVFHEIDDEVLRLAVEEADHAWIHWLVGGDVFLLTLHESDDDQGQVYDGRNFFPYPEALATALPQVLQASCYSAEYAVPLSRAAAVARSLRSALDAEDRANLELKFLRAVATAPPTAMNSRVAANDDAVVVCFNVYVPAPPPPWVAVFERILRAANAAPHFGKGGLLDVHYAGPLRHPGTSTTETLL